MLGVVLEGEGKDAFFHDGEKLDDDAHVNGGGGDGGGGGGRGGEEGA